MIDEVVVTDSIPLSEEIKKLKMVRQLDIKRHVSEAIRRVCNEESISAMFDTNNLVIKLNIKAIYLFNICFFIDIFINK